MYVSIVFSKNPVNSSYSSTQMDQQSVLSDGFIINGTLTPVTFDSHGQLQFGQRSLTVEKEILGFALDGSRRIIIKAIVDSGDGICCLGSRGTLVRKQFVLESLSEETKNLWYRSLCQYLDSLGRPKRLLIFVNPYGGKRSASKIFNDDVKPFLDDGGIEITVQETTHQLHAKEVAHTMDLTKYDGIVCVSGDGILVEVINGLLERDDWDAAMKMPLGMVPAGTGNGMAKSLLDSVGDPCTASNAILTIIRGHKRTLDVATIFQGNSRFFSVLAVAWGLVADIDIESEKYRWMGSARLDYYAIQRILQLRKYSGRISFIPAPGFESYGEPTNYKGDYNPTQEDAIKVQQCGYRGPAINLGDFEWRTISGPFVSLWLLNVPWASEDSMGAPNAKFSDGYMDLALIRDCPKLALLASMTGLSDGSHVKSPYVSYLKVKAMTLEPGPQTDDTTKGGIIDADGEVLARGSGTYKCEQKSPMAYDKIQITLDQGLATIFSPTWD